MKNLNDTGCCTEMLFISGKLQKRFGTASVEKSVQEFLVTVNEGIQYVGKCEYHMEIRGINHFCSALVNPEFLINGLTVGAVPVAAGVIVKFHMPAIRTERNIHTKGACFTVHNGIGSFLLPIRKEVPRAKESYIRFLTKLMDFSISHW